MLLSLELTGRRVLAVGGGPVSARRVVDLLDEGAQVTVVAPELCGRLLALRDRFEWRRRRFEASDLAGMWFAHTATGDPAADRRVALLAERAHIFCVNAGRAETGTAAVPARTTIPLPGGEVRLAVSTGDPRRSVAIRDQLAALLAATPIDSRPRRRTAPRVA